MSKGKRYDGERKLNVKKIFGVIIAIAVIIMIIISIKNIVKKSNMLNMQTKQAYFSVYENGKWGVIDSTGNYVINATYDEMILIPNNEKDIFICIYDVNDENNTYKTKVINAKQEELYKEYDLVEPLENYDTKQNIWYEDNLLRVKKNNKYGLINFNGEIVLNTEYDEITALKGVKENLLVKTNEKVGLVNAKGQFIINAEYAKIETLKDSYKSEYIITDLDGKKGIISTSGTVIITPNYQEIKYINSSEIFAGKINDKWELINKNGVITLVSGYDGYTNIKGENVIVSKSGKYGIITATGEVKIEPTYDELKYAFSVYYIAKQGDKYGIININNEVIVNFDYISMNYVEEGSFILADKTLEESVILDNNLGVKLTGTFVINSGYITAYTNGEYKYYNFKFEEKSNTSLLINNSLFLSKKNGKYGYVNSDGKVIVDYIFDDATEQNEYGYCAVKQNGKWGSIDKYGKQVLTPSVDLDNNIYTYFIGAWHLADEGIYYTK